MMLLRWYNIDPHTIVNGRHATRYATLYVSTSRSYIEQERQILVATICNDCYRFIGSRFS